MIFQKRNPIIEEDIDNIVHSDLPWSRFEGKTVLISGANGFLPAYMVETLLYLNEKYELDIDVIGLVRNRNKALVRFAVYKNRNDLKFIVQDVCKFISIEEKVDYIIHAASQASPKYYGKDPVGTLCANTLGTNNLLNLARDHKVNGFLFFSSGEVYGQINHSIDFLKEDSFGYVDPTDVRSCYAESKRMGETMCVSWCHQYGVPVKIVRPFHTYGPGMSLDDGRVYADFVADILNNRDIVMKSDGSAVRAFCYLADAVQGYFTVLLRGENGQAYNIGNDKGEASILDLAKILVDLFPESSLNVKIKEDLMDNGYLKSKIRRSCPDISKARSLGWEPNTSIRDGFRRTVKSWLC
jgi:UDP-glucuronate decarboxylase